MLDSIHLELRGKLWASDTICHWIQLAAEGITVKRYAGWRTESKKRRKPRIKLRNFSKVKEVMNPVPILIQIVYTTKILS